MKISAFLPVFNEEMRIRDTLRSLTWCDEIILIDKKSTDRTVEFALNECPNVKVVSINNTVEIASEVELFLKHGTCEWVLLFTASDVLHPRLATQIKNLISDADFDYDILHIPFKRYVLGINSERSPWYSELNPLVIRKAVIYTDRNEVHGAIRYTGKEYKFKFDPVACMYHLTHERVDGMMDRHMRYWRGEALAENIDLKKSFKTILTNSVRLIFVKKTFMLGYDGLMLMFAFLSYHMMSFVYKWEKKRSAAPQIYSSIKNQINEEWHNYHV